MASVQPSYWDFISSHGLPGSFSEQGYGLDRCHGLPGSFSEQSCGLARLQRNLVSTTDLASHGRKRKPTREVPFSVDVDRDSEPSQKRHCDQSPSSTEASARPDPATEVIDLTVDVEHCAICSNVLGQGKGYVSRMFVFTTCGCVLCGECLLGNIQERECKSSSVIKEVCCPKNDHFNKGKQKARQIFGLECAICYTTSADEIDQGAPHGSDLFRTSCGHTFCRRCIRRWVVKQRMKECPSCRLNLNWKGKQCCRFKTIQRGLVCK